MSGIVTYNPSLERLRECIDGVVDQVESVIIVDNASSNISAIESLAEGYPTATVYRSRANVGIAAALNTIMNTAREHDADWVLLLDQDSICSPDMVGNLVGRIDVDVAIVCPSIRYRHLPYAATESTPDVASVDLCITSGSLCSISAWSKVDGYDQKMFIDFVDFDFCARIRLAGYTIKQDNLTHLVHDLGDSEVHRGYTTFNYSSFRLRHMARDVMYFAIKHKDTPKSLKFAEREFWDHIVYFLGMAQLIVMFENHKFAKVSAIVRGIAEGLCGQNASTPPLRLGRS